MNKKSLFVILPMACLIYRGSAQTFKVQLPMGYDKIIQQEQLPGLDGNPYLHDNWENGTVYLRNGNTIEDLVYRYNVYKKQMQYKIKETVYYIGAPDSVAKIVITSGTFIYTNYMDEKEKGKDYFEVISNGDIQLLVRHTYVIMPADYNPALHVGNKNDQIKLVEKYYVLENDKPAYLLPKSKKEIFETLHLNHPELSNKLKNYKGSVKGRENLKELFDYFNTQI